MSFIKLNDFNDAKLQVARDNDLKINDNVISFYDDEVQAIIRQYLAIYTSSTVQTEVMVLLV